MKYTSTLEELETKIVGEYKINIKYKNSIYPYYKPTVIHGGIRLLATDEIYNIDVNEGVIEITLIGVEWTK